MAVGRLPESGADLCAQATMTRLENLPGPIALKRMMAAMVDLFCDSFPEVPRRIVLDIDDTEDRVHGGQQLSLFNAYYDGYCFLPIHIYEATSGKPVAVILRPGKTPDGAEAALLLRHVVRAIRARWPRVDIVVRGDSHYGRPEVMSWCERNRVGYIFALAGNAVLLRRVEALAEQAALARLEDEAEVVRRYGEFGYAARSWTQARRVIARVEASARGSDTRFIVTNLRGTAQMLYEKLYCARGQAENLIKAHKLHLASDRTSCRKATANQFRLVIHTAAYWLLHTLRGLAAKGSFWREAQFDTLRLGLIKVAGRVSELATRIKLSLPSNYPYQVSLAHLAARAAKLPP
jgi:Transposase DDE domain group 1